MPSNPLHLMVARNVLDTKEIKFFVSHAPPKTPVSKLLLGKRPMDRVWKEA